MALLINIGFDNTAIDPIKYRDFALPLTNDSRGLLQPLQDLGCIKNGLKNILSWKRGWRIINPEFGNMLEPYIAEPINDNTSRGIKEEIQNLLPKFEPRINLLSVVVSPIPDQNQYDIEIVYEVKALEVQDNINFTLLAGNS